MSRSKQNKAVALKYSVEEDVSPIVIASGYGTAAEKIIDIAEQEGIPVYRDDSAVSLLCMLEVGSNIPVELYEIIAAVYANLVQISAEIKNSETAQRQSNVNSRVRSSRLRLVSDKQDEDGPPPPSSGKSTQTQ